MHDRNTKNDVKHVKKTISYDSRGRKKYKTSFFDPYDGEMASFEVFYPTMKECMK